MKNSIIVLFICWLTCHAGYAQYDPSGYLGIGQGLSNNSVTCIHRDQLGFMWFGTYDGLNRFDGYAFKTFRNRLHDTASLINNRIVVIAEDSLGYIWVGTKHGINRYDQRSGSFFPVYFQPCNKGPVQQVTGEIYSIGTDAAGTVFIGTTDQGLLVKPPGRDIALQVPFHPGEDFRPYAVAALQFDRRGRCWLVVQGAGLCRYDAGAGRVQLVNDRLRTANCMAVDAAGFLWVGADNGVFRYNARTDAYESYNSLAGMEGSKVISLCVDHAQQLWIATDGEGIHVLPLQEGAARHLKAGQGKQALTSNAVYAVHEDGELRKWIGTLRGGINIIDAQRTRFSTVSHDPLTANSLVNDFTFSFCEDNSGNIWIGTDGGGISIWDRRRDRYTHYEQHSGQPGALSNNNVTSIVKDAQGAVWVATYGGGINRYDGATRTFRHYACTYNGYTDRFAWKLFLDADNDLWAGACMGGRLYRYHKKEDRFEAYDPGLRDVITIAAGRPGTLWLGTFSKLIQLDKKTGHYRSYPVGYPVRAVYEDAVGRCWVGTEGGGLLQLDRNTGAFITYSEQEGLPNNAVLNILEDAGGNLWLSTYNGLARFNPSTGQCKNYYESDGLQSNQFNYNASLQLASGEMLFGGIKGFNIFHPDSIAEGRAFPRLLITGLRILNAPVALPPAGEGLTLPYDKAMLSLDYVALEYSSPGKIAYAYYLEGWDNDWNHVDRLRTANYSRLKEGSYLLRVKSTNADGIWSPQECALRITVLPPWYRTWWAYSIYCALLVLALYGYRHYQRRQARLQYEIELSRLQAEKDRELHEKKLAFFTDISHEFRTPLTLIINPVKELLYSDGKNSHPKDLAIVYRNARRLLSLVDQLLLFRRADREDGMLKPVQLDITALCREVFLCFQHQAEQKKIRFDFACGPEPLMICADREKAEIVFFNLLSNAFKYTPEGGAICFFVGETAASAEISIRDSGCGIPAAVGDRLFERFYQVQEKETPLKNGFGIGLYLVKKFVDAHRGEVSYESSPGAGTLFTVRLPKGAAHLQGYTILEEAAPQPTLLEELVADEDADLPEMPGATAEETWDMLMSPRPSMLIVDDNSQLRQYMKGIFRSSFIIYEAEDGATGYQLAMTHLPDIIISDVLMEGLSGIELCRQLRANPSLSHIPVVLLTASASSEIKLKGLEGGADDYITKPFEKDLFVARITNIIKSRNTLQQYFYNEITLHSGKQKISAEYKEFLDRCIAITEQHLDDPGFNIKMLAQEIGISHSILYKKVKSISGHSVSEFIRFIRLRKAAELLINTPCNVNEAAFRVGFSDVKYFREQFCKLFEMNPSAYIKRYRKKFTSYE
ncbi:hybrid sensor histidine kinase/response regulator transcription factor [Chitinophaga japonensis]|uniref:histidine kinase n=1 Tax=Chitinophaga japonensis TaxID=104662 RepID=A0A562ST93_CHIJA|nr:hybrid sensor histidine kinase/response regulator transcription factor [Chitinophaga japonensis]TWI83990.1 signal transduction histidine kinase [Chitinophaga japonensis]